MFRIFVELKVKDFDALNMFEKQANKIMQKYQGRIVSAFELERDSNSGGIEIHILEFPSQTSFDEYRSDSELVELSNLRERAIESTKVSMPLVMKSYD